MVKTAGDGNERRNNCGDCGKTRPRGFTEEKRGSGGRGGVGGGKKWLLLAIKLLYDDGSHYDKLNLVQTLNL